LLTTAHPKTPKTAAASDIRQTLLLLGIGLSLALPTLVAAEQLLRRSTRVGIPPRQDSPTAPVAERSQSGHARAIVILWCATLCVVAYAALFLMAWPTARIIATVHKLPTIAGLTPIQVAAVSPLALAVLGLAATWLERRARSAPGNVAPIQSGSSLPAGAPPLEGGAAPAVPHPAPLLARIRFARHCGRLAKASYKTSCAPSLWISGSILLLIYAALGGAARIGGFSCHPLVLLVSPFAFVLVAMFVAMYLLRGRGGVYLPLLDWPMSCPGDADAAEELDSPDGAPTDERTPLQCVGSPQLLATYGELADVPFEPLVFNASWAWPFSRAMKVAFIALEVGFFLLLLRALDLVNPSLNDPSLGGVGVFVLWAASMFAALILGWLRPVYLRFVPGRLDVVRYSAFRRRPIGIERYDLHKTPLVVDLKNWVVFLEDAERPAKFSYLLVIGWKRAVWALFLAALSTHQPGPTSDEHFGE
jgi:hypothetical protein